jgi:uncharacterized protein (TIGR03435 family)
MDSAGNGWAALASLLTGFPGRPLVDETGDTRHFEFHLRWTPDEMLAGRASPNPRLLHYSRHCGNNWVESGSPKVQARVSRVDHAEPPSAN